MSDRIKDLNAPSPWNMRIWDEEKHQWLCDGEDNVLPYYGFDIRGGEVTAMQSMDWVYRQFEHGRKLIWERSTGLTDKNGKEIYEGDIVEQLMYVLKGKERITTWVVRWNKEACCFELHYLNGSLFADSMMADGEDYKVIGNIHENPELLGGEE